MKKTIIILGITSSLAFMVCCKKKDSKTTDNSTSTTTGSTTGNPQQTLDQILTGGGNDTTNWKSTTMCGYPPCNFASPPTEYNFTFYPNHTCITPSYGGPPGGNCTFTQYDSHTWQIINDNGTTAQLVSTSAGGPTGTITVSSYNNGQFVFSNGCVYTKQ